MNRRAAALPAYTPAKGGQVTEGGWAGKAMRGTRAATVLGPDIVSGSAWYWGLPQFGIILIHPPPTSPRLHFPVPPPVRSLRGSNQTTLCTPCAEEPR